MGGGDLRRQSRLREHVAARAPQHALQALEEVAARAARAARRAGEREREKGAALVRLEPARGRERRGGRRETPRGGPAEAVVREEERKRARAQAAVQRLLGDVSG